MEQERQPAELVTHHYDVYEVDGMPGRFYARCLCGWEGPTREAIPGNRPRADDDGEEHVESAERMLQLRSLLNDIWGLVNDPYIGEVRTIELIREKLAEQYDGTGA